ncbi:tetratricopeptide repeat protein [Mangrovibacterium marinum]|uniref:Tetratricopeptide repeat protein n=1 Tax=Mangrovibacterium marinum TaxID=1639118 RepID=A0A2T5C071_9BACT|nr:tetratricopeptide repeat protein [Mangrovibacterium marinum]PTN07976.1 tetratricopeptide repeat protein [Mangrovibacterium marinum]
MQLITTKIKQHRTRLILSCCICFTLIGPLAAQDDPEMQARQFFSNQQYAEALPVFEDLVRLYPDDPEINYYYAASLIETQQFSERAAEALLKSGNFLKSQWYLAQYYHAQSDWEKALAAYQQFRDQASAKILKSVPLDEMIELCHQQMNPFAEAATATTSAPDSILGTEATVDTIPPADSLQQAKAGILIPEIAELPTREATPDYADSIINFPVNAQISYLKIDQFQTTEGRTAFLDACAMEARLDSLLQKSASLRSQYELADLQHKEQLAGAILTIEQESYRLNSAIAQQQQLANQAESNYWATADQAEILQFCSRHQQLKDSLAKAQQAPIVETITEEEAPVIIVAASDSLALDSLQSPQAAPLDQILYKIQIGAYRNTPPEWVQRLFKKLSVLRRIDQYTDDQGVTVYTVGELKTYQDAQQMLKQIKLEGVNNATIAAYKNNERIPVSEARKLE